jgi:hypothetical protein
MSMEFVHKKSFMVVRQYMLLLMNDWFLFDKVVFFSIWLTEIIFDCIFQSESCIY